MKAKLAHYSNEVIDEMVKFSTTKIVVGKHNVRCNDDTYGKVDEPYFDGIHMNGYMGTSSYTGSILNIFSNILPVTSPRHHIPARRRHVRAVQTDHTKQKEATSGQYESRILYHDQDRVPSHSLNTQSQAKHNSPVNTSQNVLQYAVKTFNRFSNFLS